MLLYVIKCYSFYFNDKYMNFYLVGYRGIQPPPPGLGRNVHNGNPPG